MARAKSHCPLLDSECGIGIARFSYFKVALNMIKVILGLGKTGISVAEYFAKKKIPFSMCDSREVPPLLKEFKQKFPDIKVY
jgi:UDP-N-acetylmuramoylalanine-D-glutamate ligase